jgi:tetratricopeptide (TPR) repeat protein
VDAIVTGNILAISNNLVIRADLVRTSDGTQIWGQQYNWTAGDLPKLQSEIASEISEQLRLRLTGEVRKKITKSYTHNTEAYQLYLRGRYYWNKRNLTGFQKSIEAYEEAIRLDPGFALAYSGLAETYTLMPAYAMISPKVGHTKAKEAAAKALQLDPNLAEAYTALAHTLHNYDWDWKGSETNYKKAIQINPNYATAHHLYGSVLSEWGRSQEAIRLKREALNLDPLSLILNADLGYILYVARQYDAALEQLNKTVDLDPHFALVYQYLAAVHQATGEYPKAISYFQKALEIEPDSLELRAQLAQTLGMAGRIGEARALLNELLKLSSTKYVASFDIAMIYAGIGETAKAFEWLEKAFDERSYQVTALKVEPRVDLLRREPRFQELVKLLNIPEP